MKIGMNVKNSDIGRYGVPDGMFRIYEEGRMYEDDEVSLIIRLLSSIKTFLALGCSYKKGID